MVANIIMTVSQGIIPLISILLSDTVVQALELNALGLYFFTAIFMYAIIRESIRELKKVEIVGPLRELLSYGLRRVPGDISMAGILALPAFLTANIYGVKEAGYVAFGISLVNMVGAIFGPVGFITLPRLSSIFSEGKEEDAAVILRKIIVYTAFVSVAATALLVIFAEFIISRWLGVRFLASADVVRLAMLAAVPNALYVSLRSSIDAAYVRAINASNIYKALAVSGAAYLAVTAGNVALIGIPISFVLGMVVLCLLTLRVSLEAYGLNLKLVFVRAGR